MPNDWYPLDEQAFSRLYLPRLGGARLAAWSWEKKNNSTIGRVTLERAEVEQRIIVKQLDPRHQDGRFGMAGIEFWRGRFQSQLNAMGACKKLRDTDVAAMVPAVLAWDERTLSVCLEEAQGVKLGRFLQQSLRGLALSNRVACAQEACAQAGRWLAAFHSLSATALKLDRFSDAAQQWHKYCRLRLKWIQSSSYFSVSTKRALDRERLRLHARWNDLPPPQTPVHNDFQTDNLIWDGTRISVLDFTGVGIGYKEADLVKIFASIEKFATGNPFKRRVVRRLTAAFSEGYGTPLPIDSPSWTVHRFSWALDKLSDLAEDGLLRAPSMVTRLQVRKLLDMCLR